MPAKPKKSPAKRSSSWGPPRKVDHRTGTSAAFARAVADALPGVTAKQKSGSTLYSVGTKTFLAVDDDRAVLTMSSGDEGALEWHVVGRDDARDAIVDAYLGVAPAKHAATFKKQEAARRRQKAITEDDIRKIVFALPGGAEGPIWGQHVGFLIGTEKRTRFARFGPPVGGKIGNLNPPDDEHCLVLFHCDLKPELLQSSADRFFSTPHYGRPDEPGGIMTRLAENRGKENLAELAELIEDAWRVVATPEQVDERERARKRARK